MGNKYQMTVIICTYNPVWHKLLATLKSTVLQENVKTQIIIADDGSKVSYDDKIIEFFSEYPQIDYEFSNNKNNVGTVNNIYNAILKAKGDYTYVISPGDYFFCEKTLRDIYEFAIKNDIEIAFGQSQYYRFEKNRVELIQHMNPTSPEVYSAHWLTNKMKALAYCTSQVIVGACFFRKTDIFRKYLGIIKDLSKYDEDNASTYIHVLLEHKPIYYFDECVVWYEYGSGISTSENDHFLKMLENDCAKVLRYINSKKKQNLIDFILLTSKKEKILWHPVLYLESFIIRKIGKKLKFNGYLERTTSFLDKITSDFRAE